MAWDTDRTKRLLLDAAIDEFSRWGLAGARVDRIAAAAGVNKERIYQYFGKKDDLFRAALTAELAASRDEVPLGDGVGPDAVADYAGRLFDHHVANPRVSRLLYWEGLELGTEAGGEAGRAAYHASKTDEFERMLPGATRAEAAELLLTLVTLVTAWQVLGQLDGYIAGGAGPADAASAARRRRAIVDAVRSLATTLTAGAHG
ncbi:TetR/AcrR family transcriptional regulator [Agromyces sp. MMS24-JH15]|uniref:TetR/AcrR family transcriptional regulator n=1 Tax=Agromyces sp. MMS24-JH15 TaxID=3243765 RepID=UPI003748A689